MTPIPPLSAGSEASKDGIEVFKGSSTSSGREALS